jgi:hypothetical protein
MLTLAMATAGGVPLCFSDACPMSTAERAKCKAMGRECCQPKSGGAIQAPTLAGPVAAVAPASLSLAAPSASQAAVSVRSDEALLVPALLQGIGIFAYLSTFLI